MLVIITKTFAGPEVTAAVGEVIDLPPGLAQRLIDSYAAELAPRGLQPTRDLARELEELADGGVARWTD